MSSSSIPTSGDAGRPAGRPRSWHPTRREGLGVAILTLVAIGLIDRAQGQLRLSIFYLVPIAYAAWYLGRRDGRLVAVLAAGQWLFENLRTPDYGAPYENAVLRLGFFLAMSSLLASLRARTRQQAAVAELNETSLAGGEVGELMRHAARLVVAHTVAQRARVLETVPGGGQLVVKAAVGWPASVVGTQSEADMSLAADLDPRPRFTLAPFGLSLGQGLLTSASVAIGSPAEILGVVSADATRRARFTSDDLRFLGVVASVLAQTLLRRRLEIEAQEQRVRNVVEMNDHVVQGLAAALYALQSRQYETAERSVEFTLAGARTMMRDLAATGPAGAILGAADLVRARAAVLPLGEPRARPAAPSRRASRTRVVVADDTPTLRLLVIGILETFGAGDFEVVAEAGDGVEAVEAVAQTAPDIILLDLAMPRMSGLEAIPQIRRVSPETKIVVFSGFHRDQVAGDVELAGADAHLEKGTDPEQIVAVLRGIVSRRTGLHVVDAEVGERQARSFP
jgi:CheY-like chemotaxis protein